MDHSMEPHVSSTATMKKRLSRSRKLIKTGVAISDEHGSVALGRWYNRCRKACGRCRTKKVKCDGGFPCRRCNDDDVICMVNRWKKAKLKQPNKGYAEVLENTQYMLIATVKKLYTMVRNGERWNLGEPDINDQDLPIIHSIIDKLGCMRPSADFSSLFPEKLEMFPELKSLLQSTGPNDYDDEERTVSQDSAASHREERDHLSFSESKSLQAQYRPLPLDIPLRYETPEQNELKNEPLHIQSQVSARTETTMHLPIYSDCPGMSEIESVPLDKNSISCSPYCRLSDLLSGTDNLLPLIVPDEQREQPPVQQLLDIPQPNLETVRLSQEPSSQQSLRNNNISRLPIAQLRYSNEVSRHMVNWINHPNTADCTRDLGLVDWADDLIFGEYESERTTTTS